MSQIDQITGREILDSRGNPTVEFTKKEPKAVKEPPEVTWPMFGYDAARLRVSFGVKLRPPFRVQKNCVELPWPYPAVTQMLGTVQETPARTSIGLS